MVIKRKDRFYVCGQGILTKISMFNILLCCISWNEISFQSRKKRTLSTFTHLRSFWQKWNKLGKPMRERMESCYTSSSIFPIEPNPFPSLCMQNKWCMLSNNHNESICWHHIFPKHVRTFQDSFCHSCWKQGGREIFFL